jgi:hypothetical protein
MKYVLEFMRRAVDKPGQSMSAPWCPPQYQGTALALLLRRVILNRDDNI